MLTVTLRVVKVGKVMSEIDLTITFGQLDPGR